MDIDTDFEDENRGKVLDYVRFKYGKKKVANIITFGTVAAKNSIKTINRVLGGTVNAGNEIAELIPAEPGMTIDKAMEISDFKLKYETDAYTKKIVDYAKKVEGLKASMSIHPCAVLICDQSITAYMPEVLMTDPDTSEKIWVTQMEGPTCEELGCLKMDFLGLRTLGYVKEAIELIKKNTGKEIDYDNIPLDDLNVYRYLAQGNTASVFQCESDMFTTVIKKTLQDLKDIGEDEVGKGKECFDRLVAMNALVRPGSNLFIDDFADRILHPEHIEYLIPELEPILKETYGIILYQEQTMRITRDLAGFSAGQADTVRKGLAKKKKYIMDEYKDYFVHGNVEKDIRGCVANGIPEDKAIELWDIMALAASYSFNKSHAVAYSMHSIRTAWLSCYYPYEYLTAVLNSYLQNAKKIEQYLNHARKAKFKVVTPSINKSDLKFTTDGKEIIAGLSGLKGVGAGARNIIAERKNGEFKNIEDFLYRMSFYKEFNRRTIEALIYSGVFDEYQYSRLDLLNSLDEISEYVKKEKEYRKKIEEYQNKLVLYKESFEAYEKGEGKKPRKPNEPTKPILKIEFTGNELPKVEKLLKEKKYSGMFLTGNPMDEFEDLTINCQDCSSPKEGSNYYCGIVRECEKKVTKKGKPFWRFKIDNNGELSCVIFNYDGVIDDDMIVIVHGVVEIDEFGASMKVDEISDLIAQRELTQSLNDIEIEVEDIKTGKLLRKMKFSEGKRRIIVSYQDKRFVMFENISLSLKDIQDLINLVGYRHIK